MGGGGGGGGGREYDYKLWYYCALTELTALCCGALIPRRRVAACGVVSVLRVFPDALCLRLRSI